MTNTVHKKSILLHIKRKRNPTVGNPVDTTT